MRLSSLLSSLALLQSISAQISFKQAPSPNLDLSQLGKVGLVGDFESLSLYRYIGQNSNGLSPNGSQSLLARYPTGEFAKLQASDASINAMCPFMTASGSMAGIIVAGNFTGLGGAPAAAAALFDPSTQTITPLPGLTGKVNTVYCDNDRQTVYFGGSFIGGNSTNAIAWTTGWTNLPMSGFNGPVNSITKLPNGNIVFGGDFTGPAQVSTVKPGPVAAQVVNVGSGNINGGPENSNAAYSDPRNVLCQTSTQGAAGQAWLTADNGGGYWNTQLDFAFTPSMLRLRQSTVPDYRTNTWQFTYWPNAGPNLLNFTYIDTTTGQLQSCTSYCPMPQSNSSYQDFTFVNPVKMQGFQITINSINGTGGGFSGVELLQNDIYAYAIDDFNEPVCDDISPIGAKSTTVGNWNRVKTNDTVQQSSSDYLSTTLQPGFEPSSASVVFMPDIRESGNYSILLYTPGCLSDNTCDTRGIVNITGTLSSGAHAGAKPLQATITQYQSYEKYDQFDQIYIDATTDSFRPSITLTPASGRIGPQTVVASLVKFIQLSSDNQDSGNWNGLYDYDPNSSSLIKDSNTDAIDSAGAQLNQDAIISSIVVIGNTTYVAGQFSDSAKGINNIMAVSSTNSTALPKGGLNGAVNALYTDGSVLYAGGNFTDTNEKSIAGLSSVAIYSVKDNSWQSLGAGVNGDVNSIVPLTVAISGTNVSGVAVSGSFDQINAFGSVKSATAQNIAVWIPSRNNWLQNISEGQLALNGVLSAYTEVPGSDPLFAGNLDSQSLAASNFAGLSSGNDGLSLSQLPIQFQPSTASSFSTRKRAAPQETIEGVYAGLFYEQDSTQVTVVGGHFDALASNGSTISNLALVYTSDSNTVTGLVANTSANEAVTALATSGTTLFVGGSIPSGLLTYDINARSLSAAQPPPLSGTGLAVNVIALRPQSSEVYVGGAFQTAGSLPCNGLCIWDTSALQWHTVNGGVFSGVNTVNELIWTSGNSLILAGNMTINGQTATMAYYDAKVQQFTLFAGSNDTANVPGPITALSAVDNNYKEFFVGGVASNNGSAFITKYVPNDSSHFDRGGSWTSVLATPETLGSLTRIDGLQVLALTTPHSSTPLIPDDQTLLVTGMVQLQDFGNSSAALFNGTDFTPFVLSSASGSGQGAVRRAFVQNPQNLLKISGGRLALGFIVLIGLAIALGLTFLLVVAGILAEKIRRRREGYIPAPTYSYTTEKAGPTRGNVGGISPERLFGGVGGSPDRPRL